MSSLGKRQPSTIRGHIIRALSGIIRANQKCGNLKIFAPVMGSTLYAQLEETKAIGFATMFISKRSLIEITTIIEKLKLLNCAVVFSEESSKYVNNLNNPCKCKPF